MSRVTKAVQVKFCQKPAFQILHRKNFSLSLLTRRWILTFANGFQTAQVAFHRQVGLPSPQCSPLNPPPSTLHAGFDQSWQTLQHQSTLFLSFSLDLPLLSLSNPQVCVRVRPPNTSEQVQ